MVHEPVAAVPPALTLTEVESSDVKRAALASADFSELAMRIHAEGTLEETVDRVIEFGLSAMQCTHASVTLRHRNGVEVLAATDPSVEELVAAENEAGAGPDIDLLAERSGVLVGDAGLDNRWPSWSDRARGTGVRSALGARMTSDSATLGTIMFYDTHPDHFDVDDEAVAQILARHAALALARARHAENLRRAIDARKRIGQAQGILMERYDLDENAAFQVLIRYSQDTNTKLREVADRLVATRKLPIAGG